MFYSNPIITGKAYLVGLRLDEEAVEVKYISFKVNLRSLKSFLK
jgi:hypothetical protein